MQPLALALATENCAVTTYDKKRRKKADQSTPNANLFGVNSGQGQYRNLFVS